jgi:hypothetical protein
MERFNLVCKCGCTYRKHWTYANPNSYTEMCEGSLLGHKWDEHCKRFKLDNLKYLEMLSKEKEVADL